MTTRTALALLLVFVGASSGCASSSANDPTPAAENAGGYAVDGNTDPETPPGADDATATAGEAGSDPVDSGTDRESSPETPDAATGDAQSSGVGFELRGSVPYPRMGATVVIDTEHDRMIAYGGAGNDAWQLPLSGTDANRWRPLPVRGQHPPAHSVDGLLGPTDSAVYDAARKSMIVCVTSTSSATSTVQTTEIWELALDDVPRWSKLATLEPPDGAELQGARVVLDPTRHRLLLLGGTTERTGLWSLSLDDSPTFTRVGPDPDWVSPVFYGTHTLLLDEPRNRLVLFGAFPRDPTMWAFDLNAETWQKIGSGAQAAYSYGLAALVDAARDRIVAIGGDEQYGVFSTYGLGDGEWKDHASAQSDLWSLPSAVLDAERDRVIVFGGAVLGQELNETWALALDTLDWTQLNDVSTQRDVGAYDRTPSYDPVRDIVVSFGGTDSPRTYAYDAAGPSDEWTALSVGFTPAISRPAAIYDPLGEATLSVGSSSDGTSFELARLPSADGGIWQTLDAGPGPSARAGFAMAYDSTGKRAIVFGGVDTVFPGLAPLSDAWALSLGASPAWSQLTPSGTPPIGGSYQGIYDAEGERMIVFHGGITSALSLAGEPRWERLETRGTTPVPGEYSATAVLHDADGRRMILLVLDTTGTRAFALALDGSLTWHAFCPDTVTPAHSLIRPDTHAVLVPDGVFLSVSGASWRFDLATPYCP